MRIQKAQMYEVGTNVPLGTQFLEAVRVSSDVYVPAESKAPTDWTERWDKLRARFEGFRDKCRPLECFLVQKHTPEYARERIDHRTVLRCFGGTPKHLSGLSREDSVLLTPQGHPLFGAFAIRDANGKPICNSAGDPFAYRWGLRRDLYIYPGPLPVDESRQLPGPELIELIHDASSLLLQLPASVAVSLWRNWRSGFWVGTISNQNLWLDAVFELAWQQPLPGHQLHADRFAWHGSVSTALHGEGLFPCLPDKLIFPDIDLIEATNGFPMAYYSKVPDMVRASVAAIDELLDRGSKNVGTPQRRFGFALSFPGERRAFVEQVAAILASNVGRERILYDKYHEAEFAQPNLDAHLQHLYHDESDLIVVFLCAEYNAKEWCGLEWRAICDLIKKKQGSRIMFLRFDDAEIPGLFSTDGYAPIGCRSAQEISGLILQRLQITTVESRSNTSPQALSPVGDPVSDYLAEAQRLNCLPRLVVDQPGGSGHSQGFELHCTVKNVGSCAAEQVVAELLHNGKLLKSDRLGTIANASDRFWKPIFGLRYPFTNMDKVLLRFRYSNILGKGFVSEFELKIVRTGDFVEEINNRYFGPPR